MLPEHKIAIKATIVTLDAPHSKYQQTQSRTGGMRDASQSSSILTGTKSSKRQRIAIYSSICLVRRSSPPQRQQICFRKIKARFASKSSCKKYVKNNFKKMQNLMNSTYMVSSEHKSMTNHFFRTISQTETKMTVKETKIKANSIKMTWR